MEEEVLEVLLSSSARQRTAHGCAPFAGTGWLATHLSLRLLMTMMGILLALPSPSALGSHHDDRRCPLLLSPQPTMLATPPLTGDACATPTAVWLMSGRLMGLKLLLRQRFQAAERPYVGWFRLAVIFLFLGLLLLEVCELKRPLTGPLRPYTPQRRREPPEYGGTVASNS